MVAHGEREDLGRRGGPDVAVPLDLLLGLGEVEGPPPRHRGLLGGRPRPRGRLGLLRPGLKIRNPDAVEV